MSKVNGSSRNLLKQFIPMATSDIVMALGDPIIIFVLASLPDSTHYLAAFALGKSIAVFFESPIIPILPTANAMAYQARARKLLFQFTLILSIGLMIGMLLIGCFPALSMFFQVDTSLWQSASLLVLLLCPWPLVISLRRYWQGQIIRAGFTHIIAKGSLLRCLLLTITAFTMAFFTHQGAWIAAAALLTGAVSELLFIRNKINKITLQEDCSASPLPDNLMAMSRYYWPLAQSMISLWGARLLLPLLIAMTSTLNVAIWAAGWALVISISNGVRMLQQLVIRNINHTHKTTLCLFSISIGCSFSLLLFLLATTPWGHEFLHYYAGKQDKLLLGIQDILLVCSLLPLLMSLQNFCQGLHMVQSSTAVIGRSALIANLMLIAGALFMMYLNASPAWFAIIVCLTTLLEVFLLAYQLKNNINDGHTISLMRLIRMIPLKITTRTSIKTINN
ncbi:hypothetical protein [Zooshikella harenae]|uniref:Lipopolysaccharide biosynthesis protein n=1 Tax=Zooshikella harenae TaxID=2827238 RepID=A0ABS5ZBQ2_9GAMM|nr:hypothetical protein [Zooshikella harenae]MBU2711484.1 hypothetical protein [Zooshikella harenae]